jgi:hypothetical protein
VPDSSLNAAEFGYAGSGQNRSAFPKARVVALAECGTHAFLAAEIGPYATGEKTLAQRLHPRVVADYVPVAEDLDPRTQYIVDGTLLPCWSWAGHRELYSGKHKTTGMNVQVVCDLNGRRAWISDPVEGRAIDLELR